MTEKDLLKLKKSIERATISMAQLKGAMDNQLKILKDEFNCDTIEEAEKVLKKMNRTKKSLDEQIEYGLEQIESNYSKLTDDE